MSDDSSKIYWDHKIELKLENFQGEPDPNDPHDARTRSELEYYFANKNTKSKSRNKIKIVKIQVNAYFVPSQSWIRKEKLNDTNLPIILKHEQGHFDIAQQVSQNIQVKMNNTFQNRILTCNGETNEEKSNSVKPLLQKKFDELAKEAKRLNQKYDSETNFGTNIPIQNWYNNRFSKFRENFRF